MFDTLYKRSANGGIIQWKIEVDAHGTITVGYGLMGKTPREESITTSRTPVEEANSRWTKKKKEGYKTIADVYEDSLVALTVFNNNECLYKYLDTYLPKYNTDNNGNIMPMLASKYDSEKVFKKQDSYLGQWKINGLRCIATFTEGTDLFKVRNIEFRSREGGTFILPHLKGYIEGIMSEREFRRLCEEEISLDGELYIPGLSINEINSAVKNPSHPRHKDVQYWCYDLAVENIPQWQRDEIRMRIAPANIGYFLTINEHLSNISKLVIVSSANIINDYSAFSARNDYIRLGFEGIILRNPNAEYQFGKRNSTMIKYKKIYDGLFKIARIDKEPKRDLPILILENDCNEELFSCKMIGTFTEQKKVLDNKDMYIGLRAFVEFRERSGINSLPFHAICVRIVD